MNDNELDNLLRESEPPQRGADYWEEFPGAVLRRIERERTSGIVERPARWGWGGESGVRPWVALAGAAAVAVFLVTQSWQPSQPEVPGDPSQMAHKASVGEKAGFAVEDVREILREVEGLFPDQLRSIRIKDGEVAIELADKAGVVGSGAILVRSCVSGNCEMVVTFSGQEITLAGERMEVLEEAGGGVLLMGDDWVWSSDSGDGLPMEGSRQIAARVLEKLM